MYILVLHSGIELKATKSSVYIAETTLVHALSNPKLRFGDVQCATVPNINVGILRPLTHTLSGHTVNLMQTGQGDNAQPTHNAPRQGLSQRDR